MTNPLRQIGGGMYAPVDVPLANREGCSECHTQDTTVLCPVPRPALPGPQRTRGGTVTHPVGAFFLVSIPGFSGAAIELGQTLAGSPSKYQHAGIVIDGDGTTVEAQPGGARLGKLSDYHGRHLLVCDGPVLARVERSRWKSNKQINIEATIRGLVAREARKLLGTPYSALDYLALAALHLHLPSRWVRRRVETSGHLICSALVDRAYMNAGVHLYDDGRYVGDVMPADLDRWAQEHGPTIGGES